MNIKKFPLGSFAANCYILTDDKGGCVAIDPSDAAFVLQYLAREGLKLNAILLTHGHFDHTSGAKELHEVTAAPIVCHKEDVELLHHPELAMDFFGQFYCPPCDADIVISGEETHTFGGLTFRFVPKPGHSKGSMLIFCEDVLFSGDIFFAGSVGRTDLYCGDMNTLMQSIREIAAMDFHGTVYSGHGGETTIDIERKTNYYFLRAMEKRASYDDLF